MKQTLKRVSPFSMTIYDRTFGLPNDASLIGLLILFYSMYTTWKHRGIQRGPAASTAGGARSVSRALENVAVSEVRERLHTKP